MKALEHITEMNKTAAVADITSGPVTPDKIIEWLKSIKGILIPALNIAKIFTNANTDVVIDKIIAVLNTVTVA